MIQDQEGGNSRSGGQEQSRRVQAERRLHKDFAFHSK